MNAFLALVRDVWRESRDKRVVWVLGLLGLVVVAFFGSLSFTPVDVDGALRRAAQTLGEQQMRQGMFVGRFSRNSAVEVSVAAPRAPQPEDDFPLGIDGLRVVELEFADTGEIDSLYAAWRSVEAMGRGEGQRASSGRVPTVLDGAPPPVGPEEHSAFLESRFRAAGFAPVVVRLDPDSPRRFVIGAGVERPLELRGACEVSWCFGAFSTALEDHSQAEFLAELQAGLAERFAGFIGILVLLSMFAAALPELLQKGRFDLLLARPVGRVRLILFKYLGALLFVLLLWTLLFSGCVVALGVTTGFWKFGLIGCALTCTLVFAAIYPVAMLVGAATRHVTLASLAGLMAWGLEGIVQTLRMLIESGQIDRATRWKPVIDAAYWILPKSSDLTRLNQWMLARDHLAADSAARIYGAAPAVDWWFAGGTTALFAAAMVTLTCWFVARRDW